MPGLTRHLHTLEVPDRARDDTMAYVFFCHAGLDPASPVHFGYLEILMYIRMTLYGYFTIPVIVSASLSRETFCCSFVASFLMVTIPCSFSWLP